MNSDNKEASPEPKSPLLSEQWGRTDFWQSPEPVDEQKQASHPTLDGGRGGYNVDENGFRLYEHATRVFMPPVNPQNGAYGNGQPPQTMPNQRVAPPPYGAYPPQSPNYNPPYGYPPYQPQPQYGWPGYGYNYPVAPPRRPVDMLAIAALSGSILAVLLGLLFLLVLALILVAPNRLSDSQFFGAVVSILSLMVSGLVGGGFGVYHSLRALLHRRSLTFKTPPFWIYLLLYVAVIGVAYWLQTIGMSTAYPLLTLALIVLSAYLPAWSIFSLGVRRIRKPEWPTTWRRFAFSLISGATLSILLAAVAELGLQVLVFRNLSVTPATLHCIDSPDVGGNSCNTPTVINLLLLMVSGIAPIVEETVKPLAVAMLFRRFRNAREAFTLGLAAGIGFNLVETIGYMSSQYGDWLSVAVVRSGSGLLHGFGAGMVTLGWYFIARKVDGKRHWVKGIGCWCYAVIQHAIWNGSVAIVELPDPIGSFFRDQKINLGFTQVESILGLYFIEVVIMLCLFLYVTGRLRQKTPRRPPIMETQPASPLINQQPQPGLARP